jgi:hypothetical protein
MTAAAAEAAYTEPPPKPTPEDARRNERFLQAKEAEQKFKECGAELATDFHGVVTLRCKFCVKKTVKGTKMFILHVYGSTGSILYQSELHFTSVRHCTEKNAQEMGKKNPVLHKFWNRQEYSKTLISLYKNPILARSCLGYRSKSPEDQELIEEMRRYIQFCVFEKSSYSFVPVEYNPTPIVLERHDGPDEQMQLGIFRSKKCDRFTPEGIPFVFTDHMCVRCARLPNDQAFQREFSKRVTKDRVEKNRGHTHEHTDALLLRIKELQEQLDKLRYTLLNHKRSALRRKEAAVTLAESMTPTYRSLLDTLKELKKRGAFEEEQVRSER